MEPCPPEQTQHGGRSRYAAQPPATPWRFVKLRRRAHQGGGRRRRPGGPFGSPRPAADLRRGGRHAVAASRAGRRSHRTPSARSRSPRSGTRARSKELGRVEVAERVGREIAEQAGRPVAVLQAPLRVAGRRDAQLAAVGVGPGAGQVGRRQGAAQQVCPFQPRSESGCAGCRSPRRPGRGSGVGRHVPLRACRRNSSRAPRRASASPEQAGTVARRSAARMGRPGPRRSPTGATGDSAGPPTAPRQGVPVVLRSNPCSYRPWPTSCKVLKTASPRAVGAVKRVGQAAVARPDAAAEMGGLPRPQAGLAGKSKPTAAATNSPNSAAASPRGSRQLRISYGARRARVPQSRTRRSFWPGRKAVNRRSTAAAVRPGS